MYTSISDVFWIYFSDEEKWPDDITCSPYCSAARSIRHSTAHQRAYVRARGEGAQAFALARPCSCACSRCSPRSCRPAPRCERGHPWPVPCRGGRAHASLPATFYVLATYAGRASLERARPATMTAPAERPVSRVRGAHDTTAVKETGASGLACSTAARHRTARGARCRRGRLRRSRVSFFFVWGGRRSRECSAVRGRRSRDPECVSRRVYWTYGDKTDKLKRFN